MRFQTPLVPARLLRRYKRFLSDVMLEATGEEVTAHCPNPGAMMGLSEPGMRIWLEPNDDPRKKLKYGWRLVELADGQFAGIDTSIPNRIVGEALRDRRIAPLTEFDTIRAEVPYGKQSRVDFLLSSENHSDLYLEVKNAHLRRDGTLAEFPDCVTTRGARHLRELSDMVERGHRAAMLYVVQRTDCDRFDLARDLDPAYGVAFDDARAAGVELFVYGTSISPDGIDLAGPLACEI